MNTATNDRGEVGSVRRNALLWTIVFFLLLLRMVVLTGAAIIRGTDVAWAGPVYEIGTYVLTLLFVWLERARLSDYYIDGLVVWLIVLFKPLQTLILAYWGYADSLAFPQWPSLIIWMAAASLIVALAWKDRGRFRVVRQSVWWFGWGLGVGAVMVVILSYPMSLQVTDADVPEAVGLFSLLRPMSFLYQIGYAAVSEEPLFRGILWGMLRKVGWHNTLIWLVQAALFVLGHVFYFGVFPMSFWIVVPVGSLILGGLAWRSRTIASSIGAHAISNALGLTMGMVVYSWLHT